jgi:hypothetical protein
MSVEPTNPSPSFWSLFTGTAPERAPDNRILLRAASAAQHAVDYIRGKNVTARTSESIAA